jgi:RecB family exonuclease
MDARVLGNFVHNVMEAFYQKLVELKGSKIIEAQDLEKREKLIQRLLDQEVIKTYNLDPNETVVYEGQLILVSEVVKRFIDKILEHDKKHTPFTLEGVEQNMEYTLSISAPAGSVLLGGKIDRVDRKEDLLRIVDYKTGRDKLDFDSIASLYAREGKRNKAAFQTLMYAWLYTKTKNTSGMRVIPGLLNSTNLFDDDAEFGLKMAKEKLQDIQTVLPEFEARLRELLEELFNSEAVFDQTEETDNCKYCPYKRICYR